MANIRSFLSELESRLAESYDANGLRERLTEAENHLLDRADEFEAVGVPRAEAESMAIAAFGEPSEFVLPPASPQETPAASVEVNRRDLAFQLAWSTLTLGLVAGMFASAGLIAGVVAAIVLIGIGGLVSRATVLRRLALMSVAAIPALFFVLQSAYEPVDGGWGGIESLGIKHRQEVSSRTLWHARDLDRLSRFDADAANAIAGRLPKAEFGSGYSVPTNSTITWTDSRLPFSRYFFFDPMTSTDSAAEAKAAWAERAKPVRAALLAKAEASKPVESVAPYTQATIRFAVLSFLGGAALFAGMAAAQALGMVIRGIFLAFFSLFRRPQQKAAGRGWEAQRP